MDPCAKEERFGSWVVNCFFLFFFPFGDVCVLVCLG